MIKSLESARAPTPANSSPIISAKKKAKAQEYHWKVQKDGHVRVRSTDLCMRQRFQNCPVRSNTIEVVVITVIKWGHPLAALWLITAFDRMVMSWLTPWMPQGATLFEHYASVQSAVYRSIWNCSASFFQCAFWILSWWFRWAGIAEVDLLLWCQILAGPFAKQPSLLKSWSLPTTIHRCYDPFMVMVRPFFPIFSRRT